MDAVLSEGGQRIGNRVKIANGTAAVCADERAKDKSQSLEKSEKAGPFDEVKSLIGASQKTCCIFRKRL